MEKTKWIWGIAIMALAVMLSVGCFTAFAADVSAEADAAEPQTSETTLLPENTGEEAGTEASAPENTGEEAGVEESVTEPIEYSYLTGQKRSTSRNDLYAQAEQLPEDERDAFLAENGIGETPWSDEAAESYSYVGGQQRDASYRQNDDADSTQDMSGYSYLTGQQRGSSYHK